VKDFSAQGRAGQGKLKILSLLARRARKSRAQKIAEARRVGAPRRSSEAEGRANQMKFDIFDKRPAYTGTKRSTKFAILCFLTYYLPN